MDVTDRVFKTPPQVFKNNLLCLQSFGYHKEVTIFRASGMESKKRQPARHPEQTPGYAAAFTSGTTQFRSARKAYKASSSTWSSSM